MTEEQIIGVLVKAREHFRRLVQLYQGGRAAGDGGAAGDGNNVRLFQEAERVLATALGLMQTLPEKPGQACAQPETRGYVDQLLKEISDALQLAMNMDRELRRATTVAPAEATGVAASLPPAGTARQQAMRRYSG